MLEKDTILTIYSHAFLKIGRGRSPGGGLLNANRGYLL